MLPEKTRISLGIREESDFQAYQSSLGAHFILLFFFCFFFCFFLSRFGSAEPFENDARRKNVIYTNKVTFRVKLFLVLSIKINIRPVVTNDQ